MSLPAAADVRSVANTDQDHAEERERYLPTPRKQVRHAEQHECKTQAAEHGGRDPAMTPITP